MKGRVAFGSRRFLVGIFWLAGFVIGLVIAYKITAYMDPVYRSKISTTGSLGGILISSVAPLVIVFISYKLNLDILADLVLLANGFSYGFCSLYLSYASGFTGSFVVIFFMFAPACCTSLLVFLSTAFGNKQTNRLFSSVLIAAVLLCCFDYFF